MSGVRARVADLALLLGGELLGDPGIEVQRIAPLEAADAASISFLSHPRYQAQLATTLAACVIVGPGARDAAIKCLDWLERELDGEIGQYFLEEVAGWKRGRFEQNAAMGMRKASTW